MCIFELKLDVDDDSDESYEERLWHVVPVSHGFTVSTGKCASDLRCSSISLSRILCYPQTKTDQV